MTALTCGYIAMRRAKGFTLVELLVVFAIMAMVVGVVPMAFERMREVAQYRDALRGVSSSLRAARQQALIARAETHFVVDLARHSYGVAGSSMTIVPDALQIRVTTAGIEARGQEMAIRFFPDGGSTGGSIAIVRPSGVGMRMQVDWLSGRVTEEALLP